MILKRNRDSLKYEIFKIKQVIYWKWKISFEKVIKNKTTNAQAHIELIYSGTKIKK